MSHVNDRKRDPRRKRQRPSRELMAEVFPDVPLADTVTGHDTLLDITHAREVLGYDPQFSWRDLA